MPRDAGQHEGSGDPAAGAGKPWGDPHAAAGDGPPGGSDGPLSGARSTGRATRMAEQLQERRERHRRRSTPHRAAITVAGFVVVLLGIVLSGPGVPGPGLLVILIGLAMLALEFDWAERLLRRGLEYADRAGERASEMSTRRKVASGIVAAGALALAVGAVLVFEVPIPPWS